MYEPIGTCSCHTCNCAGCRECDPFTGERVAVELAKPLDPWAA